MNWKLLELAQVGKVTVIFYTTITLKNNIVTLPVICLLTVLQMCKR